MRDLHIDQNLASKALVAIALLALLAGFVVVLLPTSTTAKASTFQKMESKVKSNVHIAETDVKVNRQKIDSLTWKQAVEEVGPAAMSSISKLAREHGLKLVTFRPQKPDEVDGITEVPFLVALEGSYIDFVQFLRALENPKSKLVVTMVQLNGADGVTDRTNVTLGIVAYSVSPVEGGKNGKAL